MVCLFVQTFKRRNGGRNKHNRGHVNPIRCSNCGKCCPKVGSISCWFVWKFVLILFPSGNRIRQLRDSLSGTLLSKLLSEMFKKPVFTMVCCMILIWTCVWLNCRWINVIVFVWCFVGYTLPKLYAKMQYCVSCAIHSHVVRVRSRTNRRVRTPPPRFARRKVTSKHDYFFYKHSVLIISN